MTRLMTTWYIAAVGLDALHDPNLQSHDQPSVHFRRSIPPLLQNHRKSWASTLLYSVKITLDWFRHFRRNISLHPDRWRCRGFKRARSQRPKPWIRRDALGNHLPVQQYRPFYSAAFGGRCQPEAKEHSAELCSEMAHYHCFVFVNAHDSDSQCIPHSGTGWWMEWTSNAHRNIPHRLRHGPYSAGSWHLCDFFSKLFP